MAALLDFLIEDVDLEDTAEARVVFEIFSSATKQMQTSLEETGDTPSSILDIMSKVDNVVASDRDRASTEFYTIFDDRLPAGQIEVAYSWQKGYAFNGLYFNIDSLWFFDVSMGQPYCIWHHKSHAGNNEDSRRWECFVSL